MLATVLVLAALSTGQTPAERVELSQVGRLFYATDDSGQRWHHSDAANLRMHVALTNRKIHAAAHPEQPAGGPPAGPAAPASPSAGAAALPFALANGVATSMIPRVTRAWYGGNVTTPAVVGASGRKPDRLHLTVVGAGAEQVVKRWRDSESFRSVEGSMGDSLAVQAFDDPHDADALAPGIVQGGKPDVVIQAGDGTVLDRWRDDPGPDAVVGELRRRRPDYDPSRDPSGAGSLFGSYHEHLTAALCGVVVVGLVLFARSPK